MSNYEMTDKQKEQFEKLAYERTQPFCYGCYRVVGDDADKLYAIRQIEPDESTLMPNRPVKPDFHPGIHEENIQNHRELMYKLHQEKHSVEYGEWLIIYTPANVRAHLWEVHHKTIKFTPGCVKYLSSFNEACEFIEKSSLNKWVKFNPQLHGYFCHKCGSDDLMRHMEGVGVEWGIEWVIEYLIEQECEEVEFDDDSYDEMLDECNPTVTIGYSNFEASTILKELDPICYRIGRDEYFDNLAEDRMSEGEWIKCNEKYYVPTVLEGTD